MTGRKYKKFSKTTTSVSDYSPEEEESMDIEYIANTRMSCRILQGKSYYYSHSDDLAIVSYIIKRGIHKVESVEFWKEMAAKLDIGRDHRSLKGRFKRIVVDIDKQHLYPNVTKSQAVVLKKLMLPEYRSPVYENNNDNMSIVSLTQNTRDKVSIWLNSCPTSATTGEVDQNNTEKIPGNCVQLIESLTSESDDSIQLISSAIIKNRKVNLEKPVLSQTKESKSSEKSVLNVQKCTSENSSSSVDSCRLKNTGTVLSKREQKQTAAQPSSSDEDLEEPKKISLTSRRRIHSTSSSSNGSAKEHKSKSRPENLIERYKKALNLTSSSSDENYTMTVNKYSQAKTSQKNINSEINVTKNSQIKTSQKCTSSKIYVQESDSSDESVSSVVSVRNRQIVTRSQNKNSSNPTKENNISSQNRVLRSSHQTKLSFPAKRQTSYTTHQNKRQRTDDEAKNCENIHSSSRLNEIYSQCHKPSQRDDSYDRVNALKNHKRTLDDEEINQSNSRNRRTQRNHPTETYHHRTVAISENIENMDLHLSPVNKYCSRGNCQFCPSTSKNNRLYQTEEMCATCNRENVQTCERHTELCSRSTTRFRHNRDVREIHTRDCRCTNNREDMDVRARNMNCSAHRCDSMRCLNNLRSFSINRCLYERENRRIDCNCAMCRKCTCVGHLNERENSSIVQRSQRCIAVQTKPEEIDSVTTRNRRFTGDDVQTRINKCSRARNEHTSLNVNTQNSRKEKIFVRNLDDLVENNYRPQMHTEVRNKPSPRRRLRNDEWLCTQKETFSGRRETVEYKFRCLICCQLISISKEYREYLVVQKMNCDKCQQKHNIVYKDMKIQKLEVTPQEPIIQLDDIRTNKSNYKIGLKKVPNPFASKKVFSLTSSMKSNKTSKLRFENNARENLLNSVIEVKDEPEEEWTGIEQTALLRKDKHKACLSKRVEVSKKNEEQNKENKKKQTELKNRLHKEVDERQNNRIVDSDTDSMASLPEAQNRSSSRMVSLPKILIIRDPLLDAKNQTESRNRLHKEVKEREERIFYSDIDSMDSLPEVQIRRNSRMMSLPKVLIIRDPVLDAKCKKLCKHEMKKHSCKECKSATPERQTQKMLMSPPASCERLSESRLNQYAASEVSSAATDSSRMSKSKKKLFTQPSFEDLDQILSDDNSETQRQDKSQEVESCITKPTINLTIENLKLIQINQACIYGKSNASEPSVLKSSTEKTDAQRSEKTIVNLTGGKKQNAELETIKLNKNIAANSSPEHNLRSSSKSTVEKSKSLILDCVVPEKRDVRIEECEISILKDNTAENVSLLSSACKTKTKEGIVPATSCPSVVDEGKERPEIEKTRTEDHNNISKSVTKQGVAKKQNIEMETEVRNEKDDGQTGGTISDELIEEINKELEIMSTKRYPVPEKEFVNEDPEMLEVENLLEILTEDNTDKNLLPSPSKSTTEQNFSQEIGLTQFLMSDECSIGDNGKETEAAVLPEVLNPSESIVGDNGNENVDGSCLLNSSKSDFFSCPTLPFPKNENPEIRSRHNAGDISINYLNKHNESSRKSLKKDFSDFLMELDLTQRTSLVQSTNFSDLLTEDEDASEKVESQILTKDGEINIGKICSQDLRSYDF